VSTRHLDSLGWRLCWIFEGSVSTEDGTGGSIRCGANLGAKPIEAGQLENYFHVTVLYLAMTIYSNASYDDQLEGYGRPYAHLIHLNLVTQQPRRRLEG
jgi:hypothetical protein